MKYRFNSRSYLQAAPSDKYKKDLICYYRMNETNLATKVQDWSGNNYTGTWNSVPDRASYWYGIGSKAINGRSISASSFFPDLTKNWTVGFFFQRVTVLGNNCVLFDRWVNSTTSRQLSVYLNSSTGKVVVDVPYIANIFTGNIAITDTLPHSVIVSRSGNLWSLWVDGVFDKSIEKTTTQESALGVVPLVWGSIGLTAEQTYGFGFFALNRAITNQEALGLSFDPEEELLDTSILDIEFGSQAAPPREDEFDISGDVAETTADSFDISGDVYRADKQLCLIPYTLDRDVPTVQSTEFTVLAAGAIEGISTYFSNTGSAGGTVIKVYINGVLCDTVLTNFTGSALTKFQDGSKTVVHTGDILKLELESVATDIGKLSISVYQSMFESIIAPVTITNVHPSGNFITDFLYTDSTSWKVKLNQPITVLHSCIAQGHLASQALTAVLGSSDYTDDTIIISGITVTTNLEQLDKLILDIDDLSGKRVSVLIPIKFRAKLGTFPPNIDDTAVLQVLASCKTYQYSWDNSTFTVEADITDSLINIDPTEATAGGPLTLDAAATLTVRYGFPCADNDTLIYIDESIATYYADSTGGPTVSLTGNCIEYDEAIPLERIDFYVNDTLYASKVVDKYMSGFTTMTFTDAKPVYTVALSSGKIFLNKELVFSGTVTLTLDNDTGLLHGTPYMAIICYDTTLREMRLEYYDPGMYAINDDFDLSSLLASGLIPIWLIQIQSSRKVDLTGAISFDSFTRLSDKSIIQNTLEKLYGVNLPDGSNFFIIVTDSLGRTAQIDFDNQQLLPKDYRYQIRAYSDSGCTTEIKPGQLFTGSTYYVKSDEV